MPNHFHLVLETPNSGLVAVMHWLLSTYSLRLNHRRKLTGHVFSGRYKALLVDGSGHGYLKTVCDHVHLNPERARLLAPEDRLSAYPWSSLPWYLAAPQHAPPGSAPTVSWASTASGRTLRPDARNSNNAWKPAAASKLTKNGIRCASAGAWAAKTSGKNSWTKCNHSWTKATRVA
jgi:hypothetical protein